MTLFSIFNVFRYITFRTIYAILTALLICFIIGPWLIKKLKAFQIQQVIREDVPSRHMVKNGTPTMGGGLILAGFSSQPFSGPTCRIRIPGSFC